MCAWNSNSRVPAKSESNDCHGERRAHGGDESYSIDRVRRVGRGFQHVDVARLVGNGGVFLGTKY